MKKSHLRSISWIFLLGISLSSYIYLKNVPTEQYQEYLIVESENEMVGYDVEENKVLLPDVALVKKIIDLTKIILHGH